MDMSGISTEILATDLSTHLARAVNVAEELIARNALWDVLSEGVDALAELSERVLVIESRRQPTEGGVPQTKSCAAHNDQLRTTADVIADGPGKNDTPG
jgi:hypothetical protein